MRKTGKVRGKEQSAAGQLKLRLRGLAREALWNTVVLSGLAFVEEELEAERTALCGARYAHQEQRQAGGRAQSPGREVEAQKEV
jgi:hypothetical protein